MKRSSPVILYIAIVCAAAAVLFASSYYFGVPFSLRPDSAGMPIDIVKISVFTTGTDEVNSRAYLIFECTNESADKFMDYAELTVTGDSGEEAGSHFRFRTADEFPVEPHWPNTRNTFYMPGFNSERCTVQVDKIVYTDGTSWVNDGKHGVYDIKVNEAHQGTFPVLITEADAVYRPGGTLDLDLAWDLVDPVDTILSLDLKVNCFDRDGNIITNSDGKEDTHLLLTDESDFEDPVRFYYGEKITLGLYSYENAEKIDTVKVSLVKAVHGLGDVFISDEEPVITLSTNGKKGYPFADRTDNGSVKKFISRMEKNFKEEGLDYRDPLICVNNQYALIRYPDLDVRVELDDNGDVKDGEVSCARYMDVFDDREYTPAFKAQAAVMIAAMKDVSYDDEIIDQLSERFVYGGDNYITTENRSYYYQPVYEYNLQDGNTFFLTCSMGNELNYIAPEFYSGINY